MPCASVGVQGDPGSDAPEPGWFDQCVPGQPPDEACYAARRDPQSDLVALARAVALPRAVVGLLPSPDLARQAGVQGAQAQLRRLPPCGVPASGYVSSPFSRMPAFSHLLLRHGTRMTVHSHSRSTDWAGLYQVSWTDLGQMFGHRQGFVQQTRQC